MMSTKKKVKNSIIAVEQIIDNLDNNVNEVNRQKMTSLTNPTNKDQKYKEIAKEVDLHNSIVRTNTKSKS